MFTKSGGESAQEHARFREPYPSFRYLGKSIVMHDQASRAFVPGMGSFDHPAFGQHDKSLGIGLHRKQIGLIPVGQTPDIRFAGWRTTSTLIS